MNDEFMTLLDKYRQDQQPIQPISYGVDMQVMSDGSNLLPNNDVQMQSSATGQEMQQTLRGLLGNNNDLTNQMMAQANAQTQQAMQGANALQSQRSQDMAQTEQQASQALQQQQAEEARRNAMIMNLGLQLATGGFGGGSEAAATTSGVETATNAVLDNPLTWKERHYLRM